MAAYHDPTLGERTRGFLAGLGIHVEATSESESEPVPSVAPKPLREPPVQIQTVRPVRRSRSLGRSAWRLSSPEQIDVGALGAASFAVAFLLVLAFWVASTFPVAVKLLGLACSFAVLATLFFGLAYWIYRGGHRG